MKGDADLDVARVTYRNRRGMSAGQARDNRGLDDDDASQECAWARAGRRTAGRAVTVHTHPILIIKNKQYEINILFQNHK